MNCFCVQFLTSCDLAAVLEPVSGLDEAGRSYVAYLGELSLLQAGVACYSPALVAASCILLARVLLRMGASYCDNIDVGGVFDPLSLEPGTTLC